MPPMIAWSGTYRPITSDSQNRSRRSRRIRTTKRNIVIATITRTKVSRRLPNSMTPWIPISGVGTSDSAVQRGHVGHPSPDPVSLTSPPVPTIATWTASVAQAAAMTRRSTRVGSHSQNVRKMPRRACVSEPGVWGGAPEGSRVSEPGVWGGAPEGSCVGEPGLWGGAALGSCVGEPGVWGGAPEESVVLGSAAIGPASWECAPDVAGGGPCHPGRGRNPVESKGRMRARRALHH